MKKLKGVMIELIAVISSLIIFGIPFYYVILNSFKNRKEAAEVNINFPKSFHIIENYKEVLTAMDGMAIRAFFNSIVITTLSIIVLIVVCSMAGFILQRKTSGKGLNLINFLVLAGLMIPPAIVPTIWVMDKIGLFKTIPGLVLIEVALAFPFSTILYKGFMATIPRDIDEAAVIDGYGSIGLFFKIIMPLLKPASATIIVLSSVSIFNDFVNPLYFLPGSKNATVQLTLYNFMSQFNTSWNLLFADVVLISIPPLILFLFFNKQIIAGMTAGSVKG
jgi:raffinose/stachyose/melibiose transport system permease protein